VGARCNIKGERERRERENMVIGEFINSFDMGEQAHRLQIKD